MTLKEGDKVKGPNLTALLAQPQKTNASLSGRAVFVCPAIEAQVRVEIKSGEELANRPIMQGILKDITNGNEGHRVGALIVPMLSRLTRDEDMIDGAVRRLQSPLTRICHFEPLNPSG